MLTDEGRGMRYWGGEVREEGLRGWEKGERGEG